MGQKVNPIGLRLGINRTWDSRWFAGRDYAALLHEDLNLRRYLTKRLSQAGVSRIVIERPTKRARVTIHTARPGVVIGKKGADIEKLRIDLQKMTGTDVALNIVEIRKPEIDAKLVAENIAQQLERRVAFRRAMKRAVQSAMRLGAYGTCGVKVWVFKGEIMAHDPMAQDKRAIEQQPARG
jgi:small subunit ribosomal protein S3